MSASQRILIVEDDDGARAVLAMALEDEGYDTVEAGSLDEAREILFQDPETVRAILLDIGLPDGDGRGLLTCMQKRGVRVPVIMLTGADSEADIVAALDAGACDYVQKPYRVPELAARLRVQIRQFSRSPDAALTIGAWTAMPARRTLRHASSGEVHRLSAMEMALLVMLYRARGSTVPREAILKNLFGYSPDAKTHTVETHIYRLRRRLEEDLSKPMVLITEDGGYRLARSSEESRVSLWA